MRDFSVRAFCANLAFLLFVACLVICLVIDAVSGSFQRGFLETAARTELVLSLVSCLLLVAISVFATYALRRHRKHQVK